MKKQIPMASTTFGVGNEHVVLSPEEGNGIVCAFSYFQEVDNPLNKAFLKKFHAKIGARRAVSVASCRCALISAFSSGPPACGKAKSVDRLKVIKALETGISLDTPAGKTTIDPKTHHVTARRLSRARLQNHGFKVLDTYPAPAAAGYRRRSATS